VAEEGRGENEVMQLGMAMGRVRGE
jgi:hypothetical protein